MVPFERVNGSLYPALGVPIDTPSGPVTPIASSPDFPPSYIELKDGKVHAVMRAYNGDSETIKFIEFVASL